jgi:hypothetical protein
MSSSFEVDLFVPMPITQKAQQIARSFAQQQPTTSKAEQVSRNTLAVCMVDNYLKILGITTDLDAGDSWNPAVQFAGDVADLRIVGKGALECRPASPGEVSWPIPEMAQIDRIGYVIVQINEAIAQSNLLGFAPTAATGKLTLADLKPMRELPVYLDRLQSITYLSRWLDGIFEPMWQSKDRLGFESIGLPTFRSRAVAQVQRCQLVTLAEQQPATILQITLISLSSTELDIRVEIYPSIEPFYLPPDLQISVFDEDAIAILEARSRQESRHIQLEFTGELGDRFSIRLNSGQESVTENFVI